MSRPWRDKYPIRSLRGDGDDERFEAFAVWLAVSAAAWLAVRWWRSRREW